MTNNIKNFKDLKVWKKSRGLATAIYKITQRFPDEERYGLVSQMRRAAVSVPSNIAERHSRSGTKDFAHFLSMAIGSLAEVETQLVVSYDLAYSESFN